MSKYIDECVKKYGGLRYQIHITGQYNRDIIIWKDSIERDSYTDKRANMAIKKVKEYFTRNDYYVEVKNNENGVCLHIGKEIHQWERVYSNIEKIMKKAFRLDVNAPLVVRS